MNGMSIYMEQNARIRPCFLTVSPMYMYFIRRSQVYQEGHEELARQLAEENIKQTLQIQFTI